MPSCRSSGVLTASAVVNAGRCKLISIHVTNLGAGADTTIKLFDNASAASGTELSRIVVSPQIGPTEFDMHGVICLNGLYLEISTGTGTGAAVSVEFA